MKTIYRLFATNDHMVQNPPYWRASSLLFPHWDFKTKRPQPVKLDLPLFSNVEIWRWRLEVTLGTRGFSSTVSGVSIVICGSCLRQKRSISVRRAREKTSGTHWVHQSLTSYDLRFSYLSSHLAEICEYFTLGPACANAFSVLLFSSHGEFKTGLQYHCFVKLSAGRLKRLVVEM